MQLGSQVFLPKHIRIPYLPGRSFDVGHANTTKITLIYASLLLCSVPLYAGISNISVSVTPTAAILQYTSPVAASCTVQVSESASMSPLVHDVDPVLFPGSSWDSRPGSANNGATRKVVVGKRTAEIGADGFRYSRALQAFTTHYYRLICGTSIASGSFTTANIPLGLTFVDPAPTDGGGVYAWPSLNQTDRTQVVVDPQTGALIRRVTLPHDRYIGVDWDNTFSANTAGSHWNNAANATNSNGSPAYISGDSQSELLVGINQGGYYSSLHGTASEWSLNTFQVTLSAAASGPADCVTSSSACTIAVCLTVDGVQCRPGAAVVQQALTNSPQSYTFGSSNAGNIWNLPGNPGVGTLEASPATDNVICDGSSKVIFSSGNAGFNIAWGPGTTVYISNTPYTISQMVNDQTLVLTTNCPAANGTAQPFYGGTLGVLIRAASASQNAISVWGAYVHYEIGIKPRWDYSGDFDLCSQSTVIGPTGNPGNICNMQQDGVTYWIDNVTGESHILYRYTGMGCTAYDQAPFDGTNPDIFYCGNSGVTKIQYFGNHSDSVTGFDEYNQHSPANLPNCEGPASSPTNQPCLAISQLTGPNDLPGLLAAFDPRFVPQSFQQWHFTGVENGKLEYSIYRGGPNALPEGSYGWLLVFDPAATSNGQPGNAGCVGGGQMGCVIAATTTWQQPGARFCPLKAISIVNTPNYLVATPYYQPGEGDTSPGTGPYESIILNGDGLASNATTQCPANPWGATVCSIVTVDGEPRDLSPCTSSLDLCGTLETGEPGEMGPAQPGDYLQVSSTGEIVRLINKTNNSWTVQRAITGSIQDSGENAHLVEICNSVPASRIGYGSGEFFWNYTLDPHGANTSGNTIISDQYGMNSHYYWQNFTQATPWTFDSRCIANPWNSCYQTRIGTDLPTILSTPPAGVAQNDPAFASLVTGYGGDDEIQSHPWGPGYNAPTPQSQFFWDARPFNGGPLTSSWATYISGSLWKWEPSQFNFLNRKILPTLAAAGSHPLKDVSSWAQGNTISDGPANWYQYCVVVAAGECRSNSQPGEVFINAPFVTEPWCFAPGQASPLADDEDMCVGNNNMQYNSVVQLALNQVDMTGQWQRAYTKAFNNGRRETPFWHGHSLSNGQWMIILSSWVEGATDDVFIVKLTPPTNDSVARNTFIPISISVPPSNGAVTAIAEFGYYEYGGASTFNCTSRSETCVATGSSFDPLHPFYFENSEASGITGTPCASGCTISVPAISGRILYTRLKYLNSAGATIATAGADVTAVP